MEAADFDAGFDSSSSRGRARRALASIAASLVAITAVGVVFLHPILPSFGGSAITSRADYRVAAVDFIDRSTGWVVALVESGDYAVMHTSDGGLSWMQIGRASCRGGEWGDAVGGEVVMPVADGR